MDVIHLYGNISKEIYFSIYDLVLKEIANRMFGKTAKYKGINIYHYTASTLIHINNTIRRQKRRNLYCDLSIEISFKDIVVWPALALE